VIATSIVVPLATPVIDACAEHAAPLNVVV